MPTDALRLDTGCLTSKWGFNDGDAPDAFYDYCEAQGIAWDEIWTWSWHDVLRSLVRSRLLPLITERVTIIDIDTIHNPIRVETINGVKVDWHGDSGPQLAERSVEIPYGDVITEARRLAVRE